RYSDTTNERRNIAAPELLPAAVGNAVAGLVGRAVANNGMRVAAVGAIRGEPDVVKMAMNRQAEIGFRDLTLASSSLIDAHWPLIEHIKNGVVRQIYTSGLRGKLGEEISAGLMENPVQIHSHGGRVKLIQSGELN
ncbi:citrate lyase subunit alpha, partial [Klebsiella pneumoniae]|uniref:citrate lyase subunit alpha n=1 Tax=Klebsiella pneumoniae TaxID=573 RepID=UPI00277D0C7D